MTLQLDRFVLKPVTIVPEKKSTSDVSSSEPLPLCEANQECDICNYQCEKESTMKKHKNTKHLESKCQR